jgi:hypothetical protein
MSEAAPTYFGDDELDHLQCVVRLTVEYFHDLKATAGTTVSPDELNYRAESVFSGLDSFFAVNTMYGILTGAIRKSGLEWLAISKTALEEQFIELYRAFLGETDFVRRCRVLLDLFKLQLVISGITYA